MSRLRWYHVLVSFLMVASTYTEQQQQQQQQQQEFMKQQQELIQEEQMFLSHLRIPLGKKGYYIFHVFEYLTNLYECFFKVVFVINELERSKRGL